MIAAVVLAAGGSSRLGRPKPLVREGGVSLVRRTVDAARDGGCDPVVVVVGGAADRVRVELSGLAVEIVENESWRAGQAGSVRVGVRALAGRDEIDGVMLLVCDQPRLDADVVRRLLAAWDGAIGRRVAARYANVCGVPAVFHREWFDRLQRLSGDRGARDLLRGEPGTVAVDWPDGAYDVDRPEDLDPESRR